MKSLLLLFALLAAATAGTLPEFGPEWLERVQNPTTRIDFLYQLDKENSDSSDETEDIDSFAIDHQGTLVFPCPQPGMPTAWVILNDKDYESRSIRILGPDPSDYSPHPLEIERRLSWEKERNPSAPGFHLWKPGEPWFEALTCYLIDQSGRQLAPFNFAGPVAVIDFNQDGFLNFIEVDRIHLKPKDSEQFIDALSISTLDPTKAPLVTLFCNKRKSILDKREWRFEIRETPHKSPSLALIPEESGRNEIIFRFENDEFKCIESEIPEGIFINHKPGPDWGDQKDFLASKGLELDGIGSDDARDVQAQPNLPQAPGMTPFEAWTTAGKNALPPRQAAQSIVEKSLNPHLSQHYEILSVAEPIVTPTSGWIEYGDDGGGWGQASETIDWLKKDSAERWKPMDAETFEVTTYQADILPRRIAILHELDLVRTIPRSPRNPQGKAPSTNGGDDFPTYSVRAMSSHPSRYATVFNETFPMNSQWLEPPFDRQVSAVLALALPHNAPTGGKRTVTIRKVASDWLDPANIGQIPPGLIHSSLRAISRNKWTEFIPILETLLESLGTQSPGEIRFTEMESYERALYSNRYSRQAKPKRSYEEVEKELRSISRERKTLRCELAGDPGFEFRKEVIETLLELKKPAE